MAEKIIPPPLTPVLAKCVAFESEVFVWFGEFEISFKNIPKFIHLLVELFNLFSMLNSTVIFLVEICTGILKLSPAKVLEVPASPWVPVQCTKSTIALRTIKLI